MSRKKSELSAPESVEACYYKDGQKICWVLYPHDGDYERIKQKAEQGWIFTEIEEVFKDMAVCKANELLAEANVLLEVSIDTNDSEIRQFYWNKMGEYMETIKKIKRWHPEVLATLCQELKETLEVMSSAERIPDDCTVDKLALSLSCVEEIIDAKLEHP